MHNKVLVVGDVMLDVYSSLSVERISPEAPVPVCRQGETEYAIGGAANVAANLTSMNVSVDLLSILGSDNAGSQIKSICESMGINHSFLISESIPSTIKNRLISKGQQLLRIDIEEIIEKDDCILVDLRKKFDDICQSYDMIIFSDYNKGVLRDIKYFLSECKKHNITSLVDPKLDDWSNYKFAKYISPNKREFEKASGLDAKSHNFLRDTIKFLEDHEIENLLLTMSEDGLRCVSCDGSMYNWDASEEKVADVTGAGDTVLATFGALICQGYDVKQASKIANAAGQYVVKKPGVYVLTVSEFKNLLNEKAEVTVFTNGCFDILHPGHLRYLKKARGLGDRLIVGLNTDESIRRIKGEDRPVINETQRREMLLELDFVDEVILFDEDTPLRLIEQVSPNILVKGADYNFNNTVGAEFVTKNGGAVEYVALVDQYSTTAIIKGMKNK